MKLKQGDKVVVIAGKDKGKIGIINAINPKSNKVIVEGVNKKTYHIKPTQADPDGGIQVNDSLIHASNVSVFSGKDEEPVVSKIGYKIKTNKNGKKEKIRILRKTKEEL